MRTNGYEEGLGHDPGVGSASSSVSCVTEASNENTALAGISLLKKNGLLIEDPLINYAGVGDRTETGIEQWRWRRWLWRRAGYVRDVGVCVTGERDSGSSSGREMIDRSVEGEEDFSLCFLSLSLFSLFFPHPFRARTACQSGERVKQRETREQILAVLSLSRNCVMRHRISNPRLLHR